HRGRYARRPDGARRNVRRAVHHAGLGLLGRRRHVVGHARQRLTRMGHREMKSFDLDTVDRLLTTTKAVRRRLDLTRPVPREVIAECIRLACYAPNASNAQEWHWVVIDDPDQRRRVAHIYREVLVPRVSQMMQAKLANGDEAGARISRSILYLADKMPDVPALVIPCYDVGSALHRYETMITDPGPYGLSTHMDSGMFASILPAVWSFQLAL